MSSPSSPAIDNPTGNLWNPSLFSSINPNSFHLPNDDRSSHFQNKSFRKDKNVIRLSLLRRAMTQEPLELYVGNPQTIFFYTTIIIYKMLSPLAIYFTFLATSSLILFSNAPDFLVIEISSFPIPCITVFGFGWKNEWEKLGFPHKILYIWQRERIRIALEKKACMAYNTQLLSRQPNITV
jgi:hypothetical protein